MSCEIVSLIIFFGSLTGMGVVIFRKIPVLMNHPEISPPEEKGKLLPKLKEKIKALNPWKSFSYEIFLQKILSRARILSLKTENKTFNWLKQLRVKAKIRKNLEVDYWKEIKKSTKE